MVIENINTIDKRIQYKISLETEFLDCHLFPSRRQMAIENTVSIDFDSHSSIVKSVFDCRLPSVNNEGPGKPVQRCKLFKAFDACIHKVWM